MCLKCFNGSCVSQEFNHSLLHFNLTNHAIVLNIKLIPKEVDNSQKEEKKITKLAIGKPGGIDADTDNYDTEVTLKCHACQSVLDHTEPKISGMVNSIILSESAYFKSTVGEWEQDLKSCFHVESLA